MERNRYRHNEARLARATRVATTLADALYTLGLTHLALAEALEVPRFTVDSWTRATDPRIPGEATFTALCTLLEARQPGLGRTLAAAANRDWTPLPAPLSPEREERALALARTDGWPSAPSLPLPLTSFVGRDLLVAALCDRIIQPAHGARLLTLTGAGGIGKTRLALEVATGTTAAFADGVWLLELAALTNAELVTGVVAALFGVQASSTQPLIDTLATALHPRRLLLVLDNCEHLIDACATLVLHLLTRCPQLIILATSREVLRVPGETVWRVPPLALPDPAALPDVTSLQEVAAVDLFTQRASLNRPDFVLTGENAPLVIQICRQLDGMPLALELAAARLRGLPLAEIATHLDDRFRLLTGGSRGTLPRHQTLWATVDWSYSLLTVAERTLFGRLSVFANGWSLDEALAICAGGTVSASAIVELLADLVDKSLVQIEDATEGECYRFLETIRAYARTTLDDETVCDRMAAHFVALIEAHPTDYNLLDHELPNILAALQMAHERGHDALLMQGANTLHHFLEVRGLNALAVLHLQRAEVAARRAGDHPALVQTLLHRGRVAERSGDYVQAECYYGEGLALARATGEAGLISALLQNLGGVAVRRGEYAVAAAYLTEGLALARPLGDAERISALLGNLAAVATSRSDYEQAEVYYKESLPLARAVGNYERICSLYQGLGLAAINQGAYDQADSYLQQGLALARAIGHRERMSNLLQHLGVVALECSDYVQAGVYLDEGLALARAIENQERISHLLQKLAELARARNDYTQAATLLQESLVLARILGHQRLICTLLRDWGEIYYAQEQPRPAAAMFREAHAFAQEIASTELTAAALYGLARVAAIQGQMVPARRYASESLDLFTTIHHRHAVLVGGWLQALPETPPTLTNPSLREQA